MSIFSSWALLMGVQAVPFLTGLAVWLPFASRLLMALLVYWEQRRIANRCGIVFLSIEVVSFDALDLLPLEIGYHLCL